MLSTAPVPHPVPDRLADLIAQSFKVLSEPMRIKLLDRLRDGGATVHELTDAPAPTSRTCPSISACS